MPSEVEPVEHPRVVTGSGSSVIHEQTWPGHAVLQIAVPAMEEFIVAQNRRYDAGFVSEDPRFHHAHITVLAPLTSWDSAAIGQVAAKTSPFRVELTQVATFPNGIIHLRLRDEAPVKELTCKLWTLHPGVVPNGAPDPTPHLTLDLAIGQVNQASVAARVRGLVPVGFTANELELVWYQSGNCHWLASWPLGVGLDPQITPGEKREGNRQYQRRDT